MFFRSRIIGEKVDFHVEYQVNERDCGTLFSGPINVNVEIAKTGFVKLNAKFKDTDVGSKFYKEISAAIEDAKAKKINLYKDSNEYHQQHKRLLIFSNDPDFDANECLDTAKEIGKPFKSFVEYVFSPNAINVYIETLGVVTRVNLSHIYTPLQEKEIYEEAKDYLERRLLSRIVGITLDRVDDKGKPPFTVIH